MTKRDSQGPADESQIVIEIKRVMKVTKGGKRLKFRAVVVVGNRKGTGGFGVGKASEVPEAIRKATEKARKNQICVSVDGTTIPHQVEAKYSASRVILKPASRGHGMVVGKTMRAYLEVLGISDIVGKVINSTNTINVLHATHAALQQLKPVERVADETTPT